jgi:hypothetical protein
VGDRYVTDLADVVRAAGLAVIEVDGWQTRARGSGGYASGKPDHVMCHHTASGASSDGWPDVNYCTFGDDDAPLCNLYLSRDGTVWICCAGGSNTNGSGDCQHLSPDSMNSSALGIEAGNNGTGEVWPAAQTSAYQTLTAALCAAYGIGTDRVHSHAEWAPDRKVDPYGPSPWGPATWDMAAFRADLTVPDPAPIPPPDPPGEDDVKAYVVLDPRDGETQWVSDLATFKTRVSSPAVANDGRALFGWVAGFQDGYFPLGPDWGPFLEALPTTGG